MIDKLARDIVKASTMVSIMLRLRPLMLLSILELALIQDDFFYNLVPYTCCNYFAVYTNLINVIRVSK